VCLWVAGPQTVRPWALVPEHSCPKCACAALPVGSSCREEPCARNSPSIVRVPERPGGPGGRLWVAIANHGDRGDGLKGVALAVERLQAISPWSPSAARSHPSAREVRRTGTMAPDHVSPLRDLVHTMIREPWAHAHGYYLSPLRGWAGAQG
jgi:hypothetical protein